MIPSSENGDLIAVTAAPDWSVPPVVTFSFATAIFTARSGKEQRSRDRRHPKAKIAWQVSGLTLAEARAAMAQAQVEARAMCVVPFWTEGTITITSTAGTTVTIGVDPRADFFAPGQRIYLDDGTNQTFREIVSVADRVLTLAADGTAPAIGSGARVWPCRVCRRVLGNEQLTRNDLHSHALRLEYETAA